MRRFYAATALLSTLLLASLTVLAQTPSREDLLKEIKAKRAELDALEKGFLSPSQDDRKLYAKFLLEPNTGLLRLLPREKYDDNVVRAATEKSLITRGGGAYYSFSRLTHQHGDEIGLSNNDLSTGFAGANYGFFTNIGDVPLESVGLKTPAANLVAAYKPPREIQLIRKEQRRFSEGAELEGLPVKRAVPLQLKSTYLLRSINYQTGDLLVAFKVVRIDADGSAIILWKLLKHFEKPEIVSLPQPR